MSRPTTQEQTAAPSPLLEAVLFPFVEQICFRASQIHNLRTSVTLKKKEGRKARFKYIQLLRDNNQESNVLHGTYVFLLDGALFTVIRIRHPWSTADDAASLIGAIVTLVTNSHQSAWPHIGVTDDALSITWEEESINQGKLNHTNTIYIKKKVVCQCSPSSTDTCQSSRNKFNHI